MSAWAKIHDTIIDDPDFILTAETGWIWARMLTVAARNADFGRIGPVRKVAHMLRETEADIVAAVEELGDRIQVRDGELWFRDWGDWQTMTGKERAARHRGAPQAPASASNAAEHDVTARNATNENDALDERRGEESYAPSGAASPQSSKAGPGPDAYRAIYGRWPRKPQYGALNEAAEQVGVDRLMEAIQSWADHGWSPTNVAGMVDVAKNGISQRPGKATPNWRLGDPVPEGYAVILSEHGHYIEEIAATHD